MVSLFAAADLVDAATHTDHADVATAAALRLQTWAATCRAVWPQALVGRCQAQLAAGDEADRHYTEALKLHSRGGRPFDTARTALLYGAQLRRRRRRADARTHLRRALDTFERLGATPGRTGRGGIGRHR